MRFALLLGISLIILRSDSRDFTNTSVIGVGIDSYYGDSTLLALRIVSSASSFNVSIRTLLGLNRNKPLPLYIIRIFRFVSAVSLISLYR